MRINYISLMFIILLTFFFLDVFTNNSISQTIHTFFSVVASPLFNAKVLIEKYFEKNITIQNIKIFANEKPDELLVLSEDLKGYYVRNLNKTGIVLNEKGQLVGFVEKTGNVGYVSKWWESEFPVTLEATNLTITGYYKGYRITIPDPNISLEKLQAKVYMSEYLPYGKLLKNYGMHLGYYENGIFKINIPKVSERVILLESYGNDNRNEQ
ncbi:hypothetical protein IM42_02170 [Fervidobacterium sp. SC_NGM5_O18]|uniref:Cell shape-determining protein MreC n=1 Tax=Fervidobacterium pennivorans TaxID=93466 RepID=A0A172T1Q2_FERPE|nr:hypothetical protein [Fervidobacterium pennivorans]ANE40884.1 hypothetical protein JM64_01865 [Fervidobacterium pennivorans]PHJ12979.1 hypothetical protein IM42_02170 [Fervidobacterium sp. SC_NGM5_O18]